MKLLTKKQKNWIIRKNIKVGSFYRFPPMGFMVYAEPNLSSGIRIDTNPFTKSLSGEFFLVKDKIGNFCKGNFYDKPFKQDVYLDEGELSRRTLIEMLFIFLITIIPFSLYNWCNGGASKIDLKN